MTVLPGPHELHLWHASLRSAGAQLARLERTLARDERERARRFASPHDRRRFVVARGLLRELLGRYLDRDPASVAFAYGPAGKPRLGGAAGAGALRFNLAHSGAVVLYAFAVGRRVGIDVEEVRPLGDLDVLSRSVFSSRERAQLEAHPPSRRSRAFFDGWVRKEAVLKASGHGLGAGPSAIEVSLARRDGSLLRTVYGEVRTRAGWTLRSVPMGPRYAAAVAVEGPELRIDRRRVGVTTDGLIGRRRVPRRSPPHA